MEIVPVGDNREEIYRLILSENKTQNYALNTAYNHLYFNFIARDKIKYLDERYLERINELENRNTELLKKLNGKYSDANKIKIREKLEVNISSLETLKKAKNTEAIQTLSKAVGIAVQTQLRDVISKKHTLMSDTKDRICKIVNTDFSNDIKGILSGERSLRTYQNNPLYIRGRTLTFEKQGRDYFFTWRNKSTRFKVILGRNRNISNQVFNTVQNILNGTIKICDSMIQIKKKKMYLLLSIEHEVEKKELKQNRIIGVDIGMNVSAYCVLNVNHNYRCALGDERLLVDFKNRIRAMKRKIQKQSHMASIKGKGRNKYVGKLDSLKERERNFTRTYNHNISKSIIKFALTHQAGTIRLEKLTMDNLENETRMKWSYYQLQQMIEDKAKKNGIFIEYVSASYTSITCSECGNIDENNRYDKKDRTKYKCTNKLCNLEIHADLNAAINIAKASPINYLDSAEELPNKKSS